MKKLNLILAILLAFTVKVSAQEINWVTLNEALELQKKAPKNIMVDVYTKWCGPCKMLDKRTFHNADVVKYVNDNYYAVKFNGEGEESVTYKDKTYGNPNYDPQRANSRNSAHEFASYLGIQAYPTIVFFDDKGELITPLPGYKTPKDLELFLKIFKTGDYLNLNTQEEFNKYLETFKYTFKED